MQQPSLLLVVFKDDYDKDIWNPVRSVVGETLNCEREVSILSIFTWSIYGNMALQLAMYYVSSHASARYFIILRHSGNFEPTLTAHRHNSNDSRP